ncbi:MAG: IPT/TIG domain-containing protein [Nitrospirae bacterium]|nr:IPT/TIG domain-containing protein [Candidatus Manganitrophaceae bacterium]
MRKEIFIGSVFFLLSLVLLSCGGGGGGSTGSGGVEIQQLKAEPSVVRPGESAALTVAATGGELTFAWQADAGALSAADSNPITWTAPSTVGNVLIHVAVTNKDGARATGVASVLVTVSPTGPVITSVNPAEAKTGSEIHINGAGFGSGPGGSLSIGGATASNIVSWSDTEIRALVPEGASTGAVQVVIGGVESSPGALVLLWTKENPENVPLATAANDQLYPQMVSDGSAGAMIAWADFRNGATADIYAQRVDGSGAPQWAADGIPISTAPNNQSFPQLVSDGSGGAILVWEDNRSGNYNIYAQRINRDGAIQWTANGIPISSAANAQQSPQLIPDGAGGAIIVWLDFRNGATSDLYAQRVNAAGVVQWAADGIPVSTAANAQQFHQLIADGAGGAIVVWQDHRSVTNADVYAQRINGDGAAQWTADGLPISVAANHQQNPRLVSDGAGGALIVWQDGRSGTDKIYAQRVNPAGAVQWSADGIPVSTTAHAQSAPQVVSDGAGGALITWQDGTDINAQRVSGAGAAQWAPGGVVLSAAADAQSFPRIASDGTGGAIVTWSDRRSGTHYDLYIQRINSGGTVQWTADGVALSTAANDQSSGAATAPAQIIPDGSGGAIVAWQDNRNGTWDIYAQGISTSGRE